MKAVALETARTVNEAGIATAPAVESIDQAPSSEDEAAARSPVEETANAFPPAPAAVPAVLPVPTVRN